MIEKDKFNLAQQYFNKAYTLHLNGNIPEAIAAYKKSIRNYPTAKAHTFLGWAYSLQGKYEEAIDECYIAIELDPDFGNPYNDIGSYLISLGQYDDAIPWLEKAIHAPDYDPRHYPYVNLGKVYEIKGEWIKALEYYKKSLEIEPAYEYAKLSVIRITSLLN
jgi:tetratricopeptide (TPR) repeat protein